MEAGNDTDVDDIIDNWDDSDEAILPLKLIQLLETKDFWRKRSYIGSSETSAQKLYARVHQDPVLYRNLYHYIVFRFDGFWKPLTITSLEHYLTPPILGTFEHSDKNMFWNYMKQGICQ